ncbi:glycosyltransferase [Nitratidesulfovibrio sp.]|uniref:glycosyltransferase n=1 Tax=Nitratidesulfovibrio sp. TaxID=2802297 RepID=UPI00333ECFA6
MTYPLIAIHRGRNAKVSMFFRSVTDVDYNFDFRGFAGGSKLNPFWLLLKAWITSREIPEARAYLVEGGMLFWVGWFLKRRYPNSRLLLRIPEPAFWLSPLKGRLQRAFYRFRMRCMRDSVDWLLPESRMVAADAQREAGIPEDRIAVPPHCLTYISAPERFGPLRDIRRGAVVAFVIDRPQDAGYVKGLDAAIAACRALHRRRGDVTLLLAGAGTQYLEVDEPWIQCLGHVPIEEVFARAALCIAPARYDAFVIAVAEAALAGTIPLVSSGVGAKECLEGAPRSLVVNGLDPEEWATRMEALLTLSDHDRADLLDYLYGAFSGLTQERCLASFKGLVSGALKQFGIQQDIS